MGKLPIVTAQQLIKFIKSKGFIETHRKGSHVSFGHPDGRTTVVPVHKGEDLGRGITSKILNDTDLTADDYLKWKNKGKKK